MSAVASVAASPAFERPSPVKAQLDVTRNDQKREVAAENAKQEIYAQQEQREQVKAPVNKGQGQVIDREV
ncbi:hypothetical protein [Maritalea sp.]|jgi:hypothetical protein|uniref:hypothetical protein n=1 Tax=Maritalea sp. TaxID=2003361 RepID=UPI0039E6A556